MLVWNVTCLMMAFVTVQGSVFRINMLRCPFLVLSPTFTIPWYLVFPLHSSSPHFLSISLSLVFVSLHRKHWLKTPSHSFIYKLAQMVQYWNLSSWWPFVLFCLCLHEIYEYLAQLSLLWNFVIQIPYWCTLFLASDSAHKHYFLKV